MLVRDVPFPVAALRDTIVATCSALMTTAASTAAVGMLSLKGTADAAISTGDIGGVDADTQGAQVSSGGMVAVEGRIIDRTRYPIPVHYNAATIQAVLHSSRGSTEADRKLAVGAVLNHGDSSGGGDMAEYSTGSRPQDRLYFSSARTTDMASWDIAESSGAVYAMSNPGTYDLRAAKRYLRVDARVGKNRVTTESSGDEQSRVSATITFLSGDDVPGGLDTTSPMSTSTST